MSSAPSLRGWGRAGWWGKYDGMRMNLEVWGSEPTHSVLVWFLWHWSTLCPMLFRLDVHGASGAGVACVCFWLQRWQGRATVWAELLDWLAIHSLPCRGEWNLWSGLFVSWWLLLCCCYKTTLKRTQESSMRNITHGGQQEFTCQLAQFLPPLPSSGERLDQLLFW